MIKYFLIILCLANSVLSYAQLGGKRSFEFLNLPANARTAALGSNLITTTDSDPGMFLSNPALLSEDNDNYLTVSHMGFYADVKLSSFSYTFNHSKFGPLGIGVQRLSYGEFESFDASGNSIGKFDAAETALILSKSHSISVFTLGASMKIVQSSIDNFSSSAILFDLGGVFKHPDRELSVGLNMKNFGVLLSDYSDTSEGSLPFDVQLGVTFKPQFMPFRFSFTASNLNRQNVSFFDPSVSSAGEEPGQVDKVFRHLSIGTELVLSKNFNIRFGYNHLLRKELRLRDTSGGAGFSFGFMARIKAFEFSYTNTSYHANGGRSYFTIASNLNRILKKKTIKNA